MSVKTEHSLLSLYKMIDYGCFLLNIQLNYLGR